MTSTNQDDITSNIVESAPNSRSRLQVAGQTGKEWFDFSGPGAITSDVYDVTFNNTDRFEPGTILFAIEATPTAAPQEDKPPSMAAYLCETFQQMVFDKLQYEFICSKGSLTNAKLIAAFIPDTYLEDFKNFSTSQRKALMDRQANKVIFSPSPNEINMLTAEWAHLTSIAVSGQSMGTICLALYQSVVANIADGGTNDIHLTCRFSCHGLKLRYPVPPGLGAAENYDNTALLQLEPFNPEASEKSRKRNGGQPSAESPLAPIVQVQACTMVGLPIEDTKKLDKSRIINAQNANGEQAFIRNGIENVFGLTRRKFVLYRDSTDYDNSVYTHKMLVSDPGAEDRLDLRMAFPFTKTPDIDFAVTQDAFDIQVMLKIKNEADQTKRFMAFGGKVNEDIIFNHKEDEYGNWTSVDFNIKISTAPDIGGYQVNAPNLTTAACYGVTPHINDDNGFILFKNTADLTEGLESYGTHACFWSELTPETDPSQVVKEAVEGIGLPLIANLQNQSGYTDQDRVDVPQDGVLLKADMVVGTGSKRGVDEIIGTIAHVAETFLPVLGLFLRDETAIVVDGSIDSPIHYVPTDGLTKKPGNRKIKRVDMKKVKALIAAQNH